MTAITVSLIIIAPLAALKVPVAATPESQFFFFVLAEKRFSD
jgi:hypothetical protein